VFYLQASGEMKIKRFSECERKDLGASASFYKSNIFSMSCIRAHTDFRRIING